MSEYRKRLEEAYVDSMCISEPDVPISQDAAWLDQQIGYTAVCEALAAMIYHLGPNPRQELYTTSAQLSAGEEVWSMARAALALARGEK